MINGQLLCRVRVGVTLSFKLKEESVLGCDKGVQVVVPVEGVSRKHAKIAFEGGSFWIEDLKSTNGTFLNGQAVTRNRLRHLDVITLGKKADLVFVVRAAEAAPTHKVLAIMRAALVADEPDAVPYEIAKGEITIGRAPSNNLIVDVGAVSKVHARIERTRDQLVLEDLGSANGTFVNGTRLTEAFLKDGDVVSLGGVETYKVVLEMGEVTSASGKHSAASAARAATDASGAHKPRFSAEWKTRMDWSTDEREELAALRRRLDEHDREKQALRDAPVEKGKKPAPRPAAKPAAAASSAAAKPTAPAAAPAAKPDAAAAAASPAKPVAPSASVTPAPAVVPAKPVPPAVPVKPTPATPPVKADVPAAPPAPAAPMPAAAPAVPKPPPVVPRPPVDLKPAAPPLPSPAASPKPAAPAVPPPVPRPSPVAGAPPVAPPLPGAVPPASVRPAVAAPPPRPPSVPAPPVAAPPARPATPAQPVKAGPIAAVRLTGVGTSLSVTQPGAYTIGRSREVELRVDHPTVSRKHARLILSDDRAMVYLQDQGGANGTRHNGKEVEKLAPLADGDTIGIGEVDLDVSLERV
jgi:pSer/pThr/pTyr-binding forkhead associated (FHA) protein